MSRLRESGGRDGEENEDKQGNGTGIVEHVEESMDTREEREEGKNSKELVILEERQDESY